MLLKTSKANDDATSLENNRGLAYATSMGGTGLGASLVSDAYHAGELTGRRTLHHGTSEESKKKILEEGLKGTTPENSVTTKMHDKKIQEKSFGKVFTTDKKGMAADYAMQAHFGGHDKALEAINKDPIGAYKQYLKAKYGNAGIVKLNVPVREIEERGVINPLVDMPLRDFKFNAIAKVIESDDPNKVKAAMAMQEVFHPEVMKEIEDTYNTYRKHHIVFNGDLSTKFMPESKNYLKNGPKEIFQFIKTHPKMFAKGIGKATGGIGLIGSSAYLAHKAFNSQNQ